MEWPSKSIPQGGVFHPPKVQYSADTKNYLKLLMDESRLNNNIRQKINYALRSGESLPKLHSDRGDYRARAEPSIIIRTGSSRRRSQSEIIKSGAYEREKFVPDRSKEDREVLKARLQNIMANGKGSSRKAVVKKIPTKPNDESDKNRFDELMQEIKERQDWLNDMEALGEGHKHREVINLQIEARLREIQKLKPNCQHFKAETKK